jgi:hypothetical protein
VYCFNLHFIEDIWYGATFHMLIYHMSVFFCELSVKVIGSFLSWVIFLQLSFKSSLDNLKSFIRCLVCQVRQLVFSLSWQYLSQNTSFHFNELHLTLLCIVPLMLYIESLIIFEFIYIFSCFFSHLFISVIIVVLGVHCDIYKSAHNIS